MFSCTGAPLMLQTSELSKFYLNFIWIDTKEWTAILATQSGHKRKSTGAYYAPCFNWLSLTSVEPAIYDIVQHTETDRNRSWLRICDPACGSGLFGRRCQTIGQISCSERSGEAEPGPTFITKAMHDVVHSCIYGVDINPMSIELCKISLWMENNMTGDSISILSSNIRCGNALLSVQKNVRIRYSNNTSQPSKTTTKKAYEQHRLQNRSELKRISLVLLHKCQSMQQSLSRMSFLPLCCGPKYQKKVGRNCPTQKILRHFKTRVTSQNENIQRLKRVSIFHWWIVFPHIFDEGGLMLSLGIPVSGLWISDKKSPYQRVAITHLYASARGTGTYTFLLPDWESDY